MAPLTMLWFRSESTVPYTSNRDTARAVLSAVPERGRNPPEIASADVWALVGVLTMPSLFRFLLFFGFLGGLAYGALVSLATFVKYQPRVLIRTVPACNFLQN